jgi:hypothetical protein
MKKVIAILLIALSLLLPSCGKSGAFGGDDVIMNIGGYPVTYDMYRYFFLHNKDIYSDDEIKSDTSRVLGEIKESVIENLTIHFAERALEEEYGIRPDNEIKAFAKSELENAITAYGSDEILKDNYYASSDLYVYFASIKICLQSLGERLKLDGVIPNDGEVIRDAILNGPDCVRVVWIMVTDSEEDGTPAEELAESILARANAGDSFNELIGKYSEDYSLTTTDGSYYMRNYGYSPEFENAIFSLDENEISDVIESDGACYIIKRLPKEADYVDENLGELAEQYTSSVLSGMVMEKSAELEFTPTELYDKITFESVT